MKSGGGGGVSSAYGYAAKRRWRGLAIGVLGLVILSMLVPLVFLLGLHNGFHSPGYASDQRSSPSTTLGEFGAFRSTEALNHSEVDQSGHVVDLMRRLAPTLNKDAFNSSSNEVGNETINYNYVHNRIPEREIFLSPQNVSRSSSSTNNPRIFDKKSKGNVDENVKQCEVKYGSYCLWRHEHREDMKDSVVKRLKDQLFVARAYYPSIAKLPSQEKLTWELKQNIQEFERILSESTIDADLPSLIGKKLQRMEAAIAKAKSFPVDCNNVDKKLRQILDMTEDEANFHMKQSAFLYQLAVQTMPRSFHCLSMRLTVEHFKSPLHDAGFSRTEKYMDPALHHYVIFSKNILASSVVINSTVTHARGSADLVFHVLTDRQNYFAMELWFVRNTYKEATVQVLNVEHLNLDNHSHNLHFSLPVEFRISFQEVDDRLVAHTRTEYLSLFSHIHFLLPEIFQNLRKVVVLDDDIVVQKDLSALWGLDLGGKVIGAKQLCSVRLSLLKDYLGESDFNRTSCAWMSGLNLIDLDRWRELHLTETYGRLLKQVNLQDGQSEAVVLRSNLLTFQHLIYGLDGDWSLSGLGHDYDVDIQDIRKAAVLHYNGNMKPWLELGIPTYRCYWRSFLNQEDEILSDCNVDS